MQEIKLEIIKDTIRVTSPYNEKFIYNARNLRGNWKDGAWWFDDSIVDYVREVMMSCFGTTGETAYENCTLLITDYSCYEYGKPVSLFGRQICRAFGRDSGARLGDGIVLIKGQLKSGGSVKNWTSEIKDATFEIKNFPVPSLELPTVKQAIEEGWCTVKQQKEKRSVEDIQAEIKALKARIKDLEKECSS
jgi:hypothetical protein